MLKKFTTTFYINLFHNINTAPFQKKKQLKSKKQKNCNAPLREHTQAQENWYLILILK